MCYEYKVASVRVEVLGPDTDGDVRTRPDVGRRSESREKPPTTTELAAFGSSHSPIRSVRVIREESESPGMRSGVILAGGRSTRFGDADKAVASLAGTPMTRRVADRLEPAVDSLVINCREDQQAAIRDAMAEYPLPVAYALDETPDRGPVAGIRNGLAAVDAAYAAVVACDMPFLDAALVELLFDRAAGNDGAVPRTADGWFQTTQAVYRADAMVAACEESLRAAEHPRVLDPLDNLAYVVVEAQAVESVAVPRSFENINTQAEFQQAQSQFEAE